MKRFLALFLFLVAAVSLPQCARGPRVVEPSSSAPIGSRILLISIDGWRWDYREWMHTPTLDRLAARGVQARQLQSVFPSKTFPAHHTLVTGLLPDHHGIVGNDIHDDALDERFSLSNREAVGDGRWWEGEPIWVRLEQAGYPTAVYAWPGSEASIGGVRPTYWMPYAEYHDLSHDERANLVVEFFDREWSVPFGFATLYFSDVDTAGHIHGPESAEVREAAEDVDATLGRLFSALDARGLLETVDVVVVSDHGMAALDPERVVYVSDYLDPASVDIVGLTPVMGVWPQEASVEEIYERLAHAHPSLSVYRKAELPEHLRYGTHRRVAPIVAIADEGWTIAAARQPEWAPHKGDHGYDPTLDSMQGLFVAAGPGFKQGLAVDRFRAVDVYELLCALAGVEPHANDGDRARARALLAR